MSDVELKDRRELHFFTKFYFLPEKMGAERKVICADCEHVT